MKYLTCLMVIIFSYYGYSQQRKIDSLEAKLKSQTEQDVNRLNTLNALASEYDIANPRQGLIVSDQAIKLANQLQLKDKLALAYKTKAQNYHAVSQDSMAMVMYDKSSAIQTELKSWKDVGKITFNKGLIYFGQSKYDLANECNKKAYEIFEKEKDSMLMGIVLNSMGINQMYRSLYPEALDTYLKAASIYEKRNNTSNNTYAGILTNIGLLYTRLKKNDLALEYYNKSLILLKKLDYNYGVANALTNIGNLYDYSDKPKIALDYYYESYTIMKDIDNLYGIASALTNIGITHINLKNYDKAVEELKNSIALFQELENTYNLSIVHQNIGIALMKNPKSNNSDISEARFHLKKSLDYAKETNSIQIQSNTLEYLSQLRARQNDYKLAYTEYKEAIKLKDSFISTEKKEEIAKLEAKYEYQKKEAVLNAKHDKEQAVKEAEITRQKFVKNTSIIGGSSLVGAAVIGFILYRRKRDAVAKSKEAEFNAKVSDTELKALRSQMNPHFIFNSLNSIGDYILKNDTQSASNYLSKFAKLMRMTLENSEKKEILLEDDITLLKTYMDIERKRFNNKFDYSIEIASNIDEENTLVPPMILQPFIENSIIHGLANKEEKGQIKINFVTDKEMLICSVDDNGVGRVNSGANNKDTTKKSLGMAITKSRIDIINKVKKTKGDIKIIDKEQGTRIEVSLPIELEF